MQKINKFSLLFTVLIVFLVITGFSRNTNNLLGATLNADKPQKKILILNSYGSGLPIPDETKQGIYSALETGGVSMKDVFFEDLDIVRSSSSQHKLNLVTLLQNKLEDFHIGIVVLMGSPAIDFLAKEGKDLFPDAALIALIAPNVNSLYNDDRKIMFLPWRVDPGGSVKLAMKLFPNTENIFVITGANDDVLPFLDEAKKEFIPWKTKLDIEYSNEMTYEEMIQRASSLPKESIILYSTFFTDKLNRSYIPAEVVSEVCEKSKVPVFATLEYYMGLGIIGGALLETERLGKQVGSIALDYLNGQIVLSEQITYFDTPIHTMVDWQELNRFDFNANIPNDCLIIGKPPTLWEQNKLVVIIVIGTILLLFAFVLALLFWNRRIRKMEIAAFESERQLKLIADNFVNGMLYQVAMLDEDRRQFNYISENVNQLYGCTVEEAKENANLVYGKIHPDDINRLVEKEKIALKNMSVFEAEARVITPDGNIRWAYYMSQARIINGIVCWDGIEVDMTERKQMELELVKAKEKAEESDRLKSSFLANMSHEVRTPMNGILGFTELLSEPNLSGKEKDKYIDIIKKSGERMLNTVNDIIDISKIDSGLVEVVKNDVNINDELESLYAFFKPEAERKGLKLILKNELLSNEFYLETDKGKLISIFTNLIKNAIKYTEKGSIEIVCSKGKNSFRCYVKDTGIGIQGDSIESVFNRFDQAGINDNYTSQGSGLGLAITKSYVEMLNGKIWVDSDGRGSTFHFTLPWKSKKIESIEEEVLKTDQHPKENAKKHQILIAEDDLASIELLKVILKDVTREIIFVSNGVDAVNELKRNPTIEIILMDINMPGMNGYEATRQIRGFNRDVVIIAQTAYAITGDRKKSLEAGCDDYISKPIKKEELLEKIEKFLR